jgi:hypothetical protein
VKDDRDIIGEYLDNDDHKEPLEGVNISNELESKEDYLQTKNQDIEALFQKVDSKIAQMKAQSNKQLPSKFR